MRRPLLACALGLATIAAPTLALADGEKAKEPHVGGIVHIRESFPAFHGKVGAENETCEGPRPVKLYERKRSGERKLLGKTTADLEGRWQILVDPLKSGAYFATAPEHRLLSGGESFLCLRAKSETVVVD